MLFMFSERVEKKLVEALKASDSVTAEESLSTKPVTDSDSLSNILKMPPVRSVLLPNSS